MKKLTTIATIVVIGLAGCSTQGYHSKAKYNKPVYPYTITTLSSPLPPEFQDWTHEEKIEYLKAAPKIKKKIYSPVCEDDEKYIRLLK